MIPLDTITTVPAAAVTISLTGLVGFALTIAGLGLTAILALLRVGVMFGRHEEFKEAVNKRLNDLERADNHAITREELDARFNEMRSAVVSVNERFTDFIGLVKSWMEKQ